jgi:hypothetical protein
MNDDGLGIPHTLIISKAAAKKNAAAAVAVTVATASATSIPAGIVADERRPGMYRVKLGCGRLSDMLNLARARDVLASRR